MAVLAKTANFEPSPHIYKLSVAGCRYEPFERTLTGFRVKGQIGIVTALHGVAGCQSIHAQSAAGGPGPLHNLIIGKVDIERDVAVLWSNELDKLPADGLEVIVPLQTLNYEHVTVIGYPYGLFRQRPTIEVKILETTELGNLIPPDLVLALDERSSPAIDIQVLSVQAHLVPGHSGAPLINGDGKVIGVGNGGLDLGRVEMSWAIPWQTIVWQTVSTQMSQNVSWKDFRRLQILANGKPHLFSFAIPDVTDDSTSSPEVTPLKTPTATPAPRITPTPRKVTIKLIGVGAAREIKLVSPLD